MTEELYTLVIPETYRSGPGTKTHLSPDGANTTLCKVENNAHGLKQALGPGKWTVTEAKELRQAFRIRRLCKNCLTIHAQKRTDS